MQCLKNHFTSLGCEAGKQLLWGLKQRQVWHFKRKVKGRKERPVLSSSMQIAHKHEELVTSFWKGCHWGFYLTFHHKTEELQEDPALWQCVWSFFREMGKKQWFQEYMLHLILHQFGISLIKLLTLVPPLALPLPKRSEVFFCMQALQTISSCSYFTEMLNWFIGFCSVLQSYAQYYHSKHISGEKKSRQLNWIFLSNEISTHYCNYYLASQEIYHKTLECQQTFFNLTN